MAGNKMKVDIVLALVHTIAKEIMSEFIFLVGHWIQANGENGIHIWVSPRDLIAFFMLII